jgi:hypothetical protein
MQAPVGGQVVCGYVIFRRLQVDFNVCLMGERGGVEAQSCLTTLGKLQGRKVLKGIV